MLNPKYAKQTPQDLLLEHSAILEELIARDILRTHNNPTGDYTEWFVKNSGFGKDLGLELENNSASGFDAKDTQGNRYQIKGRRRTNDSGSVQLGVIRNIDDREFDFLVAVIFKANWEVDYAAKIPYKIVKLPELAKPNMHQNGRILHLRKTIFDEYPDIVNITERLRSKKRQE